MSKVNTKHATRYCCGHSQRPAFQQVSENGHDSYNLACHWPSHSVLLVPLLWPLPSSLNMTTTLNDHYHYQAWLTTLTIQLHADNISTSSPLQTPVMSSQLSCFDTTQLQALIFDTAVNLANTDMITSRLWHHVTSVNTDRIKFQLWLLMLISYTSSAKIHDFWPLMLISYVLAKLGSWFLLTPNICIICVSKVRFVTSLNAHKHPGNPLLSSWHNQYVQGFPLQPSLWTHSIEQVYHPCQSNVTPFHRTGITNKWKQPTTVTLINQHAPTMRCELSPNPHKN